MKKEFNLNLVPWLKDIPSWAFDDVAKFTLICVNQNNSRGLISLKKKLNFDIEIFSDFVRLKFDISISDVFVQKLFVDIFEHHYELTDFFEGMTKIKRVWNQKKKSFYNYEFNKELFKELGISKFNSKEIEKNLENYKIEHRGSIAASNLGLL